MKNNPKLNCDYQNLDTPFLLVDKPVLRNNLARLSKEIEGLGAELRPHFKTLKSLDAAPYLLPEKTSPVTVSTLKEAEALACEGYTNIIYAVGISGDKLPRVYQLLSMGVDLKVLLDSKEQALVLNQYSEDNRCAIPALIEIDCDGHRGGIDPNSAELLELAELLHGGSVQFKGVLTHAGESYRCFDETSLRAAAENEVKAAVNSANRLRAANIPVDIVSIGSTPTAHSYQSLHGITEVRAGVYGFFDLVMAGIGVCTFHDIAARVVTTVIGHNKEKGWVFIDAGWMALSSDRGTAEQPKDCGYGLLTDSTGSLLDNLQVTAVNQEHGIVNAVNGGSIDFDALPIGSRLQVLPNHACATASMHSHYHVFDKQNNSYEIWTRIQGW
ncbi:DSD1 family PLP-dependent enzyme [Enterovibrio sp. ZSDZ35]|uniref:DSD1 family PLP-dependent enzyme n=1 Tax=Enterovibrio qingdaonensis TaxID=2899818 RepID=A0ABT5QGT2_9GAMM|nr:DSD1 family PLP-dependent enzyme [Enterovibrio sp. ZSDZ35]MDD1780197.1 DSD1 family PLP-dependent enzyme [Enterovibrio sp. ZSDZ35]